MNTIDRCNELPANNVVLTAERDGLAQQNELLRNALGAIPYDIDDGMFSRAAKRIETALALPNTAADILRQRDVRTLRDAAAQFGSGDDETICILSRMANEIEAKNG